MWNDETLGTGLACSLSSSAPPPSIASFLADFVVPGDPFKSLGGEHVCQSKTRGCIAHALFHEASFRPIFEEAAAAREAIAERRGFVSPLKGSSGRKPSRTKRISGATGVAVSAPRATKDARAAKKVLNRANIGKEKRKGGGVGGASAKRSRSDREAAHGGAAHSRRQAVLSRRDTVSRLDAKLRAMLPGHGCERCRAKLLCCSATFLHAHRAAGTVDDDLRCV